MYLPVVIASFLSLINLSHQTSFADILSSQKNLSSFSDTLKKSHPDLLTFISQHTSSNPITVLAPSNAAFAKTIYYPVVGPAFSNNDIGAIKAILEYHVVTGSHPSTSLLPTFQYFPTWLTNTSFTNVTGGQRVGGVMQSGKEMIWTSGQSSRSSVSSMDISFDGGTIHVIESFLTPPTSFPATAEVFSTAAEPYQLTSFLGATYLAPNNTISPLAKLLNETSDITIFAPNNVAMEMVASSLLSLASSTSNSSLSSTNLFQHLLSYHIIIAKNGPLYSTSFPQNTSTLILETLAGPPITISFQPNSFFVNSARVLTSDLMLANGVMHVLDNVLNPDIVDGKPDAALGTQNPVYSTGGSFAVSEAPFTSSLPNRVVTGAAATQTGQTYGAGGKATTTSGSGTSATGSSTTKSDGKRENAGGLWLVAFVLSVTVTLF